jgi:triosephosphate isomerase
MRHIIANWKMVLTPNESEVLAEQVRDAVAKLGGVPADARFVICPTFTALEDVGRAIAGSENDGTNANPILLGAQDVAPAETGAHTGEVSVRELQELGCAVVIVGHSERRQEFGETDAMVHEKVKLVLSHGMTPIVCVGETREEREAGRTMEVVQAQIRGCLGDLVSNAEGILIAYEPRWVIGTGVAVSVEQAEEVCVMVAAEATKAIVLYGGAVDAANAQGFLASPSINGLLIGTTSRDPQQISQIVAG